MDLQAILRMASQMGIGQDKIQQALQMSNKYPKDIQGLRQVINDNGGSNFLDKALNFYNKPLVKIALSKAGITPEIIEGLKKDLGVGTNGATSSNNNDDIMSRLKHLK